MYIVYIYFHLSNYLYLNLSNYQLHLYPSIYLPYLHLDVCVLVTACAGGPIGAGGQRQVACRRPAIAVAEALQGTLAGGT